MSEISGHFEGTAVSNGNGAKNKGGLAIERVFTKEGVHPYDEVEWVRRDVVMTNWRDGSVNFEQKGVEFPDYWSLNAVNIVTTKYFRGAVGTEAREWSLKQVINRVVGKYVETAWESGYIKEAKDVEIFEHELTWMLMHQVFAFNSPVWFNVGTQSSQQISACFLLAVEDDMESILNWYSEEGMIFKGGSGSGVNLSKIRSSKELLTSGGTASGPVSFMRGADSSAGAIKSGGATRRAAKMVVLDVDHPDIEEFVQVKAKEENKIKALRDAGFDMDLGGADITSVQYQNANNSVRVSDEFMQAVEDGKSFDLTARTTGEVIDTVDAKGLFRQMAQAAWECADPGIQYDGQIQDWHTTPESGRITTSNPCFTADTMISTDKGLIRFDELIQRANVGETFGIYTHDATSKDAPIDQVVATTPENFMITGTNEIVKLEFADGRVLRCTPNHRIWTTNKGYIEAKDLTEEDTVLPLTISSPPTASSYTFVTEQDSLVTAGDVVVRGRGETRLPEKWTEEFAHLLGWLVGDGSFGNSGTSKAVWVYSEESRKEFLERHSNTLTEITGMVAKPSEQPNGTVQLRCARSAFSDFLIALGMSPVKAGDKRVPRSVLQAPQEIQAAFLRGLFDCDGCAAETSNNTRYIGLSSVSIELLRDVQMMLGTFGINGRIYATRGTEKGGSFKYTTVSGEERVYDSQQLYDLRVSAKNIEIFARAIGFDDTAKASRVESWLEQKEFYNTKQTTRMVSRSEDGWETTYNLSEPRNHSYIANGVIVSNCSEYLSVDNSSCNLSSINLIKFLKDDGTFDTETFTRAVEYIITAMEISITFGDFPTEKITDVSRRFRQLGIGVTNLGALIMAMGFAYDSPEGRSVAASVHSLMTATAYRRSAEIAGVLGAYDAYARNSKWHTRVINKHRSANEVDRRFPITEKIFDAATAEWDECIQLGAEYGWRNAQISLAAPTGTISFFMDADTTGIEPEFALTKFKKLVGGGSMKIVNQTVPLALKRLGYQQEQIEAIVEYIAEHGHVVDAPGLKQQHYAVFDCALGERAITPMGHVRLMAAIQPYVSGAQSKTINMPESATVEDIEDIYFQGWKLGLKALAVYRDNCKIGQPLSTKKAESGTSVTEKATELDHPKRKRLPKIRPSSTVRFSVGGAEGYLTEGFHDKAQTDLGEIFIKMSKQGSTLAGVMDALSIAVSIGMQYGVPLEAFVSKFVNTRFEPAGMTDDPDIRMATSLLDYIGRRLALDAMSVEDREMLGILTTDERASRLDVDYGDPIPLADANGEDAPKAILGVVLPTSGRGPLTDLDAPLCVDCGIKMQRAGSCFVCESCGSTSGCS